MGRPSLFAHPKAGRGDSVTPTCGGRNGVPYFRPPPVHPMSISLQNALAHFT